MECRTALLESQGDWGRAMEILKQGGLDRAEAKTGRQARQGIVGAYIHPGSKLGTLIEVNCETDFVARTEEFKTLVHDLALQVAATDPRYISAEEANPQTASVEDCLLLQPYIKDPNLTVAERIKHTIAKVGENIIVRRFARFELGRDSKV